MVPVPTSVKFEKEGLVDAYRDFYPDVLKHQGFTWSPFYQKDMDYQRIDRLYIKTTAAKPVVVKTAELLPREMEDKKLPKWERQFPSDHSALLMSLEFGK